jgi:murein DD-endopeptidase MepM/ murein hydrolase activator NlpD
MQQSIPTPTAGADGRIIYVVKPGETCTRVALLNGITVEQLRQLNSKLDQNCALVEGQELLIGIISLAGTPTAGPSPTPAAPTVSPTPFTGTTEICVLLFNDSNGNALREETEPAVAGGAVSVTENNGEYSAAQNTVIPTDPTVYQGTCFSNVPEGSYHITVGIPENYNPTMDLNYSLDVKAGDRAFVDFGIQSKAVVADPSTTNPTEPKTSPIFGIIGGLLLLGGAGLGYYAWRSGKPESKLSGKSGFLKK